MVKSMKTKIFVVVIFMAIAGWAQKDVKEKAPVVRDLNVRFDGKWRSLKELETKALSILEKEHGFTFDDPYSISAWIEANDSHSDVKIQVYRDAGKKSWVVHFGRDGLVSKIEAGTLVY